MNYQPTFEGANRHPSSDEVLFRVQLDAFLSEVSPRPLIDEFIDRRNAKIPDTFVPSARGIATFNLFLVELVNREALYRLGVGTRPRGWVGKCREGKVFSSPSFACAVTVRRYGKLWAIERDLPRNGRHVYEVLCLAFGPTPIFHRLNVWAITLAQHCHPDLRDDAEWLRWVPIGT
jgi:hypothetical protein